MRDAREWARVKELFHAALERPEPERSVFLDDASIPWQRHGYVAGPPYDANADVEVWAELSLVPIG